MAVAYARRSGVGRIYEAIERFRNSGGRVKAIVGIDDQNTSLEGLETLLSCSDEVYVYDDRNPFRTFHPKLYVFERRGKYGETFIGSSNLTQGGLFSNYEMVACTKFDLKDMSQKAEFDAVMAAIDLYSDTT